MAKKVSKSPKYDIVKKYYDLYVESEGARGWSLQKVKNAVVQGWITADEFKEITGEDYDG